MSFRRPFDSFHVSCELKRLNDYLDVSSGAKTSDWLDVLIEGKTSKCLFERLKLSKNVPMTVFEVLSSVKMSK